MNENSDVEKVYLDGETVEIVKKFCQLGNTNGVQERTGTNIIARVDRISTIINQYSITEVYQWESL